jgi:hypothetical protein
MDDGREDFSPQPSEEAVMALDLGVAGAQMRDVARLLKAGFDDLQEADSGWWYVDLDHPAFGRDPAESLARRVAGLVIPTTEEPGAEADALVVPVGYEDSFTGDVHLGNGMIVNGSTGGRPTASTRAGEYQTRRLAAVALFNEGGLCAIIGTLEEGEEAQFHAPDLSPTVEQAIREWLELAARGEDSTGVPL